MTPQRIQRRRARGWQMPPDTIYVGRPTKWGNPFEVGKQHGTREECLRRYRLLALGYLAISMGVEQVRPQEATHAAMCEARRELRGKNLACWCPLGKPCHADVLLEIANSPAVRIRRLPR